MRADQLLLQRQLASSRAQAQRLIASGVRWRSGSAVDTLWKTVGKNSDELPLDAHIELLDLAEARYVSRGGLKLEGALKAAGVVVAGKACLDVGQSTGGFTDCLLQHGAAWVVGVDVGQGQLHPAMRAHPQVVALEQVNARELAVADILSAAEDHEHDRGAAGAALDGRFDLIVGDLSFISQTLVLPALVPLLRADGHLLMLVKPQFELQPGQVGKGGIVKDASLYAFVEKRIRDCLAELGMKVCGWMDSPITGGDGNREFFVHATAVAGISQD